LSNEQLGLFYTLGQPLPLKSGFISFLRRKEAIAMKRGVLLGLIAVVCWSLIMGNAIAGAGKGPGQLEYLQQQIDALKAELAAIQLMPGPEGPQGPPGPAGPAGQGAIKVYDANNQFVGNLVNVEPLSGPVVYVPAIGKLLAVSEATGEVSDDFRLDHVRYELPNCDKNGNMYQTAWSPGWDADYLYIKKHLDANGIMRFYKSEPVQPEIGFSSYHAWGSPDCLSPGLTLGPGYLLREVQLPLTFPLAIPLRLE
jgi:hypothetical protein